MSAFLVRSLSLEAHTPEVPVKSVLKNFTNFTRKHLSQSPFLKVAGSGLQLY